MRICQTNTLPYVTATGPKWNKKICAVWFYSYESGVFIRGVILLLLRTLSAYTAACQSLPGGVGRGALWGIMNTMDFNMRLLYFLVLILAIQLFVPFWLLAV